jgi:hypothetical protein
MSNWAPLVFERNLPLVKPNPQNLPSRSCITVWNTKSKMFAWQPSLIFDGADFQKEPISVDLNPPKNFQ